MAPPSKPLAPGLRCGKWTVLRFIGRSVHGQARYACRCECGVEGEVEQSRLRNGGDIACRYCAKRKHGMKNTPEYRAWVKMRQRCENQGDTSFERYGARGVRVCDEWRTPDSFERFFAHIGPRPSVEHSIDRVDPARGYEPGNVRWATRVEQARNKRNTRRYLHDGVALCLGEWAERAGLPHGLIAQRLRRGLSIALALEPNPGTSRKRAT